MADVAASRSRVCAAFGSWEMDKEKADLVPNITLQYSTRLSLLIYNDAYFVKILENGYNGDEQLEPERVLGLEKEIQLMILAGDCSIQPVGRVHNHPGSLCGVIMHLGVGIAPLPNSNMPKMPKPSLPLSNRQIIDELTNLVPRLHAKGIIHGDIKPDNLLLSKSSSRLLFCDFGSAMLESESKFPRSGTNQYNSPFRLIMERAPLARADDLYATGITIWELYTGCSPFDTVDSYFIEDVVASGFQPNLCAVDDDAIRQLILSYLDAGNPALPEGQTFRGSCACVAAEVVFADCVATPPHTCEKVVHFRGCLRGSQQEEGCQNLYRVQDIVSSVERLTCNQCSAVSI